MLIETADLINNRCCSIAHSNSPEGCKCRPAGADLSIHSTDRSAARDVQENHQQIREGASVTVKEVFHRTERTGAHLLLCGLFIDVGQVFFNIDAERIDKEVTELG